jgi:hypothetical protein
VWRDLMQEFSQKMDYPAQVALLLPLSGRAEPAGAALRDGFLAAYYQQLGADRPQVRTYDVARMDVASAYLAAVTDGAGFVVGPLTRDEVAAVARVADGRTTVLALNYLPESSAVPPRFYQFALSPEDEARQVARRAIADGRPRGVALVPAGDWGQRVLGAFTAELQAAGGQLADQRTYPPGTTDFGALIIELFGVRDSEQRHARLQGALGTKLEFVPQRRSDLDFIFIPGQPGQGRLIRPQLKFNYAGDLPAYSVSDVFEPGTSANSDLDGVIFPDIPWMLGGDPAVTAVRDSVEKLWPDRAKRRGRLFAMGFDAYRLVAELRRGTSAFATPVTGMTGRLRVDADRRVRRDLDWAQMRGGTPRLLPAANTTP